MVTMAKNIQLKEHLVPEHLRHLIPLNEYQAAEVLGLSVKTLRRMRHEMRGPIYLKFGRRVVYPEADLAKWIDLHRVEPTS